MRYSLKIAVVLTIGGVLWSSSATAQPQPAERVMGGAYPPWLSWPGWYGPGPAGSRPNDVGPGNGWQYYGVANGPSIGVPPPFRTYAGAGYGYGYPGWFGGPPGASGSFWTNGRSLYGAPVPTYRPTPGVFGSMDDDKRFFTNPPPARGLWIGLGYGGTRSPSPRFIPKSVSVYPAPPMSIEVLNAPLVTTADGEPCLKLLVKVPDAEAEVWVEKTAMKAKGTDRVFESPGLARDSTYQYELIARWTENGKDRTESRTVQGKAGQTIAVDFTKPAG